MYHRPLTNTSSLKIAAAYCTLVPFESIGQCLERGGRNYSAPPPPTPPTPFYSRLPDRYLKKTWTVFPPTSDVCFLIEMAIHSYLLRALVSVWRAVGGVTSTPPPTPFYSRLVDKYLKTTWTVFSPTLGVCFFIEMAVHLYLLRALVSVGTVRLKSSSPLSIMWTPWNYSQ